MVVYRAELRRVFEFIDHCVIIDVSDQGIAHRKLDITVMSGGCKFVFERREQSGFVIYIFRIFRSVFGFFAE